MNLIFTPDGTRPYCQQISSGIVGGHAEQNSYQTAQVSIFSTGRHRGRTGLEPVTPRV